MRQTECQKRKVTISRSGMPRDLFLKLDCRVYRQKVTGSFSYQILFNLEFNWMSLMRWNRSGFFLSCALIRKFPNKGKVNCVETMIRSKRFL